MRVSGPDIVAAPPYMREMLPLAGGLVAVIVVTLLVPSTGASTAITLGVPMLTGIAVYFALKMWSGARRNGDDGK